MNNILYLFLFNGQFDQSDLMLHSAEYYQLGLNHSIMHIYYNILVKVATMMGADMQRAQKDMKDLLKFEIIHRKSYHTFCMKLTSKFFSLMCKNIC